jgi:hypothetical protein
MLINLESLLRWFGQDAHKQGVKEAAEPENEEVRLDSYLFERDARGVGFYEPSRRERG